MQGGGAIQVCSQPTAAICDDTVDGAGNDAGATDGAAAGR